ncbi:transcription factor ces-2 [Diorhabda carinulata]|uniref:transcription factor ces-2 n=1 Tax=Diorhabda carinulata TaxID=1163345 RepID=UPI0025A0AFAB|nr:transcription factor ces-2 [Diorhabda carinulata]
MDSQSPNFRFTDTQNSVLPVSAFSTYSLLRNCNYLLSAQSQEPHFKSFLNPDLSIRCPSTENTSKSFLTPSSILRYQPSFHFLPEQIRSRTPPDISQYSPLYDSSNNRRQRGEKKAIPDEQKDDKYYERRRRNNQAAKKSRDARKMREDQIALRATILEHENAILRAQVLTLREESSSLRQMLLQKKAIEIGSRDPQLCIS